MVGVLLTFAVNVANFMFDANMFAPPCKAVRACWDVFNSKADTLVFSDLPVPNGLVGVAYFVAPYPTESSLAVLSLVVLKVVPPFSMAMYASCLDSSLALSRKLLNVVTTARLSGNRFVFRGKVSLCDFLFVTI